MADAGEDEDGQCCSRGMPERGCGPAGRGEDAPVRCHRVLGRPHDAEPAASHRSHREQPSKTVRAVATAGPLSTGEETRFLISLYCQVLFTFYHSVNLWNSNE